MKIPSHIHQFRSEHLSVSTLFWSLIRMGVLHLDLKQGYGKSYVLRRLISFLAHSDIIIIVAAENNRVLDEYEAFLNEERISNVRLHGRSESDCPHFSELTLLRKRKLFKKLKKACKRCIKKCRYYNSKQQLSQSKDNVQVVLLTYSYLLYNKWLFKLWEDRISVQIMDEPGFLSPKYTKFTTRQLVTLKKSYKRLSMSDSDTYAAVVELLDHLIEGRKIPQHYSIPTLSEEQEEELYRNALENILPELLEIQSKRLALRSGSIHIRHRVAIKGDFTVIAAPVATGVITGLYRDTAPHPVRDDNYQIPEGTQLIRLDNSIGAFGNFTGNIDRLAAFTAMYILARKTQGKQVLLVAKKGQIEQVCEAVNAKLAELCCDFEVVFFTDCSLAHHIPITNYGVSGFNSYEHFDCVFTVTTYNAKTEVLQNRLNYFNNYTNSQQISSIDTNYGTRQVAGLLDDFTRKLANNILHLEEVSVILQAVGRIRPFTNHNREMVVIYRGDLGLGEAVVATMDELRGELNLPSYIEYRTQRRLEVVQALLDQGYSRTAIAEQLGVSTKSIQRILKGASDAHK